MNVAVIPARGGSKRIPKKNIRQFCGKPIIAWPIEVAKQSGLFEHILVSTDDDEIAEVSKSCGAEIPFMRPAKLSDDYLGEAEVMAHAVSWMHKQQWQPESVCCIYATAAFIREEDLKNAYDLFKSKNWSYVFAATTFSFPIQRAIRKMDGGGIEMFYPGHYKTRSQDLVEAFHDAGQFYIGTPEAWINRESNFRMQSEIIVLPRWRVQDIDTIEDWENAEKMFNAFMDYK